MLQSGSTNFVEWLVEKRRTPRPISDIPGVLSAGKLKVVFQPLVDFQTGKTFAFEALVRSTSPYYKGPPALFEKAIDTDCCGALGRIIRELATAGCPHYPLFINIHPNEFDEGWLVMPDDPIFTHGHRVFLEITESVPLSHFSLCNNVLQEIRSKGACLAVDDLGAGYSNLKYIADLAPEIVKIDRALVTPLPTDKRMQILVTHIVRLCADLGAKVVIEGIEEEDEMLAAMDTGAHYGQGYYFAKPAFPPPRISTFL